MDTRKFKYNGLGKFDHEYYVKIYQEKMKVINTDNSIGKELRRQEFLQHIKQWRAQNKKFQKHKQRKIFKTLSHLKNDGFVKLNQVADGMVENFKNNYC